MMRWVEHASTMASGDPPSARRCCRSRPAALAPPLSQSRSRPAALAKPFSPRSPTPSASGHVAVLVKRCKLVLFGGLRDKDFLDDVIVLDTVTNEWTRPVQAGHGDQAGKGGTAEEAAGQGDGAGGGVGEGGEGEELRGGEEEWEGGVRPCARAFHAAAAIEGGNMFVFGGRSGKKRCALTSALCRVATVCDSQVVV
ncbi:unnamed protein product, partial [Closterium sp. Naga37s-1]